MLLAVSTPAAAATVFDEATVGDFSTDGLHPTSLDFQPGSNEIFGTTGRGTVIDRDYVTFTVPVGYAWSAVIELPGTQSGGSLSFFGVQAGPQVTVDPNGFSAAGLLGWTHYDPSLIGTDILPAIGTGGLGSDGFVPPLPAGTYSLWIQDFNAGTVSYGFDIQISQAPEPGSAALVLFGLAAALGIHNLGSGSRRTISR
ncbi:MAG TPA: hypothetical protein VMR86_16245 [Myxococcota bacterium]|nr:hypothetical protein [Myxococcota bacterium]